MPRHITLANARDRFNASARPPMDLIPKKLAALILERDRVLAQRDAAAQRVNDLTPHERDETAANVDQLAAAEAARKGEPIPAPTAAPQLARDREEAARALTAQEAALVDVTNECDTLASELYWDAAAATATAAAKAIAEAEAAADRLADIVEAAVRRIAVHDWLHGAYEPDARISAVDIVPDLARRGMARDDTRPIAVRQAIRNAATAALTD